MVKRRLNEPLEEAPSLCLDCDDIKIIADHYGLDYGECIVETGNLVKQSFCNIGCCLIDSKGCVVDDVGGWRNDELLIRKFFEHDLKYGFIDDDVSFEVYFASYVNS